MSTYLITGGAGSLGKHIVDILIGRGEKVRAMDMNEAALASLKYPSTLFTPIYGDVRDYTRVHYAMRDCNYVIHTAAMKNLEITENDVSEMILTNTIGTDNVARASIECGCEAAVLVSTDKAVSPSSAYGASKLLAEREWQCKGRQTATTRFPIFRSGNFKQSAGNVLEVWEKQYQRGEPLTITDPDMERYFINTRDAAEIVADMPGWALTGDIVIPKMRKYRIMELLGEEYPDTHYRILGARQGEKLQEKLMTEDEHVKHETDRIMVVA